MRKITVDVPDQLHQAHAEDMELLYRYDKLVLPPRKIKRFGLMLNDKVQSHCTKFTTKEHEWPQHDWCASLPAHQPGFQADPPHSCSPTNLSPLLADDLFSFWNWSHPDAWHITNFLHLPEKTYGWGSGFAHLQREIAFLNFNIDISKLIYSIKENFSLANHCYYA